MEKLKETSEGEDEAVLFTFSPVRGYAVEENMVDKRCTKAER